MKTFIAFSTIIIGSEWEALNHIPIGKWDFTSIMVLIGMGICILQDIKELIK